MRLQPILPGLILLVQCYFSLAQTASDSLETDTSKKKFHEVIYHNLDSLRALELESTRSKLTPYIAPSYTPEMQLLFTAGGLYTFTFQRENPILKRSSIPFSIGYSTNKSLQVSVRTIFFFRDDLARLTGEFWLKSLPDNYWGVGYDNGKNIEKSDSTTQYHRDYYRIYGKLVFQFKPNFFAGPIIDFNKTIATDLNPVMMNDPAIVTYGTSIKNTGAGGVIQYDSRDIPVNAYKGVLLDLSAIFYNQFNEDENRYWTLELDYRQYASVGHRRTIAWQVKTRGTHGSVPWPELSQLGTPFDLRGYTWGQYRDENLIFGLVEYRHMFNRAKPNKKGNYDSRFGFVTWAGTGSIAPDFAEMNDWLPNFGGGIRFETEPRMNVRIDYGWGVNSNAFYISFNEAF